MPVKKRTSKVVSYNEQDDDDDFIPIIDNTKKNRMNKSMDSSKVITKQPLQKHDEKLSKSEQVTIEISDEESTNSQSTVSNDDIDDQDENLLPKTKRMKHDEEDDTNQNEEESIDKTEGTINKTEISTDLNTSQTCSTRISDLPKRNSSIPLGFPTSKINIPSPHISRVGLSRKSSTIKPLHPNYTSRIVHE